MNLTKTATALVITSALTTSAVMAHDNKDCNVSLNYDLAIKPNMMVVSDNGTEKYRIEQSKLFVQGKKISLDSKQTQLLNQYSDEMYAQVPEVIDLVNDAMEMASGAVTISMNTLLGDDASGKIEELMEGLQARVAKIAYQDGSEFYLGATDSTIDSAFDEEFEKEIEDAVKNSIGSIMISLGSQLISSDGGSFDEKMASFEQKMEKMGNDIETQVEAKAQQLEYKADAMCDNFKELAKLEVRVRKAIPAISEFPVAVTEKNGHGISF
ncbi:YggN family protein [Shewanella sp. 202IG2-18]|uniref:YggN family protein n=1 Tax=Parashewanella hymeniacidonis TaxID=2807618 RepID=UPI001960FED5|nr:YggN family protein [Parashewanella hymeniacidonis]MBM7071060.1 YggN family protein [Parashewanella hymeniacidonis]